MAVYTRDIDDKEKKHIEEYDVLIFTAIQTLEQKAIDEHLLSVGANKIDKTQAERDLGLQRWLLYRDAPFDDQVSILTKCFNAAGNATAGIEASKILLSHPRPKLVVFCGIGGSLNPSKFQLGDVVISQSIHWRGYDKISGNDKEKNFRGKNLGDYSVNGVLLNHLTHHADQITTKKCKSCKPKFRTDDVEFIENVVEWRDQVNQSGDSLLSDLTEFNVRGLFKRKVPTLKFGKFFSWDYVLNQKHLREEILNTDRDLAVVEMECGGISQVARWSTEYFANPTVSVFSIRGISDLCNEKTDDFFREMAADHSAAFLCSFLKDTYDLTF